MPPLATITAGARNSNSPTVFRDDATPRAAVDGSSTAPRTPITAPSSTISSSTRWRCANRTFALPQQPAREDVDDRRPGPPGDVEPRHRVAVSACVVAAALGPADEGEGLQPALAQPAALLPRGEVDVGVRPLPRPVVLGPVEAGGAEPVLQRQLVAVADAQPALFGAVDEEQPAERPERLTTEVVGVLLVDDQHRRPRSTSSQAATRPARPAPTTMTSASAMAATLAAVGYRRRRSARGTGPSGRRRARTDASAPGRRRRASPAAGRACAGGGRRPRRGRCPRGVPCARRTAPACGTTTAR